ncbi:MAG TPA: desulfoferrodoxin [Syntrophorhabdales bacterium]|nr:desulfoferrodoxin [Syntrophorhabdales bacterium]
MADRMQVYKCEVCGNIIEVVHAGKGVLACCNQPMKLMSENTVEASLEKHVPVVEKSGDGVTVKVGSVPHPMDEKHYIEWIEIAIDGPDGTIQRQYLKPGQNPNASFIVEEGTVTAREYCTLHGLWKA